MYKRNIGLGFLFLLAYGQLLAQTVQDQPIWNLIDTVAQRLILAKQVALAKWDTGIAVEDRVREQSLLSQAVSEAKRQGLVEAQIEQSLRDQIEANKLIQYALLAQWRRNGKAPEQPRVNLVTEIRPQLERLQSNLFQQWAQTQAWRAQQNCPTLLANLSSVYVEQQHIDTLHALALDRALANICFR